MNTNDDVGVPEDAITITPTWFDILASHDAASEPTIALALQDPKVGPLIVELPVEVAVLIGTALINGATNHFGQSRQEG